MQHQNASYDITAASARIHNVIDRYSIFTFLINSMSDWILSHDETRLVRLQSHILKGLSEIN